MGNPATNSYYNTRDKWMPNAVGALVVDPNNLPVLSPGQFVPVLMDFNTGNLLVNTGSGGGGGGGGNVNLTQVGGVTISLGSKASSSSLPVVIASDQGAIPITGSITANNASVGAVGANAPTSATLLGGSNGTSLIALKLSSAGVVSVDGSGVTQPISASALPLPSGASTSALQTTGNTSLATIATNTTGLATSALQTSGNTSLSTIATNTTGLATSTLQNSGNSSLSTIATNTTGAATATLQTAGNSSLSTVATNTGRIPSQGAAATSASLPVNIASDQTVPVSVSALPLPTGAATATLQTSGNSSLSTIATNTGKIPSQGAAATAASLPVNIASDQTVPVSATALPLPAGAATSALQPTLNGDGGALAHVTNFPSSYPVTGTFWQTTQPVSGTVSVSSLPAIPTGTNSIGTVAVSSLPAIPAGTNSIGTVIVSDGTSNIAISTNTSDGISATQNRLRCASSLLGFNGTSWDQVRAGLTASTSTFTGFINGLNFGVYNSTPQVLTNGQGSPAQVDAAGYTQVASQSTIVTVTPTVTAATYAVNKCVGGVQVLTGALRTAKNTGILNSIGFNFATTAPTQGFIVTFFSANPTSSTFTDNTVAAINAADIGKVVGQVTVAGASSTLGTWTGYTVTGIGLQVTGTAGTVYAVIQCLGASVFAATTTFTNAEFGFLQD